MPGAPRTSRSAILALTLALLIPSPRLAAEEPADGAVTILGTGPLRKARLVVRGTLDKVKPFGMGVEMANLKVLETLWGTAPSKPSLRLLTNEAGFFAGVNADAVFFLDPLEGGDRFTCVGVEDCGGTDGAARLAAIRRSLEVERKPRAERAAALRASCFESLGASDAWTRRNAGREVAHLSRIRPDVFTVADSRDLRRLAMRDRDPALRPSLVEAAQALSRAAADGKLAPDRAETVSLHGAPLFRKLREDPDPKERRRAAAAIAGEGAAGEAALVEALEKDSDAGVRASAADSLGGAGGVEAAATALRRRLDKEEDPAVRGEIVESLGLLRVDGAVPTLREIARNDPALARGALFALARIRSDGATAALRGVRSEAALSDAEGARDLRDLVDFLLSEDFQKQEEALRRLREADR